MINSYSNKYILVGHTDVVFCLKKLSSTQVASAGADSRIIIWNWVDGTLVFILNGHTNVLYLSSLELFDEQTLISGSWDQTVKFWNITNGTLIRSMNVDIQIDALAMLKISKAKFLLLCKLFYYNLFLF